MGVNNFMTTTLTASKEQSCQTLLASGHTACTGCGEALAAKLVLGAAGSNVIVTDATGCLEVFTTRFPQSSWEVPFIHSLFENSAAVASGIEAALRALGRQNEAKVIAQGGDGEWICRYFGPVTESAFFYLVFNIFRE